MRDRPTCPCHLRAFTLLETLIAVALFALIAGAVYAISAAALEATSAASQETASQERLEAFLRAARNSFLNMPSDSRISLRVNSDNTGPPDLVFRGSGSFFGMSDLGGGELLVSARPRADGSRMIALQRVPASDLQLGAGRRERAWLPLFPQVERLRWEFLHEGQWTDAPGPDLRPALVRLSFHRRGTPERPIEAIFWIPPLAAADSRGGRGEEAQGEETPTP